MDQQYHQQNKRLWLIYGRLCLTIGILGLITVGLYYASQYSNINNEDTEQSSKLTVNDENFVIREKRSAADHSIALNPSDEHETDKNNKKHPKCAGGCDIVVRKIKSPNKLIIKEGKSSYEYYHNRGM